MKKEYVNKLNLYKTRKLALIPILISGTIILNGCGSLSNNRNFTLKQTPDAEYTLDDGNIEEYKGNYSDSEDSEKIIDKKGPMTDLEYGNITKTPIDFKIENFNGFNEYLNSLVTYYEYEKLYDFNSSLTEYNKLNLVTSHKSSLSSITIDSLYSTVKNNNEKYKKSLSITIYKDLKTKELKSICEIIVNTINNYIKENKSINVERVKCVLSDLKIFNQLSSVNNAFVTDDNCLILSPNMLKIAQMINGNETDKDVFIHEINHLLQKGCNCDLKNNPNLKNNFGLSYSFNNLKVNSLNFSWLYEASAEKNMMNYTGHDLLVYKNMIGYLESLSLVNILNDNYNVNDTEELSFKRTLDDLYKYFNVSSASDKLEILNLMYSIEVMQQAPNDFYKAYQEQTGTLKTSELVDEINYNVKSSICQTLSKLFYRNLSKNIVGKNATLEDVFYLISLFENDLNNHLKYDEQEKYEYNEEFINKYIEIQDNFFYQLSKCLNCSQESIEEMFLEYRSNIKLDDGNIAKNYSLEFLDEQKISYLNERAESLKSEATSSIKNVQKQFNEENLQKVYK